jgi:hypothetical protein
MPDSLEIIQQVHQALQNWLTVARQLPDPDSQPANMLTEFHNQLKIVDEAIRLAPPSLVATPAWRDELAAYAETLREVRARMGNLEIMLRIRQAQASAASNRVSAIRSWSELAKKIG